MSSTELSTLGESVARFRSRAQAIFRLWAYEWLRLTCDPRITRDRATLLAAIIQVLYWSVLNRNPTVTEWASDVVRYGRLSSLSPALIRADLTYKKAQPDSHAEDTLNMSKPWWALYQLAGCDETLAARDYARQVGIAFLGQEILDESVDWSNEENVRRIIEQVVQPSKPSWWTRFKRRLTFFLKVCDTVSDD